MQVTQLPVFNFFVRLLPCPISQGNTGNLCFGFILGGVYGLSVSRWSGEGWIEVNGMFGDSMEGQHSELF